MILIIEDDPAIANLISYHLEYAGYSSQIAHDGLAGKSMINQGGWEIILLDLMLPGLDGFRLLRHIKSKEIPVIIITARDQLSDKIKGLEGGADDYICKPFEGLELVARIRSVLRRAGSIPSVIKFDDLEIHLQEKLVRRKGLILELTPKEYDLLECLAEHPNTIFSRDKLMETVWGYDTPLNSRTIDMHINRLRKKLGTDRLQTSFKRGYKWVK